MKLRKMDISSTFYLQTQRTARIAVLGEAGPAVQDCFVVMHGYRQLAERFLRRFAPLAAPERLILAPEGLSRFYLADQRPHVGASWMTREDREHEIEDQFAYLELLYRRFAERLSPTVRWHLFGFSQGVATLWRWLLQSELEASSITICCGIVPEEENERLQQQLQQARLCNIYALADEFIPVRKSEEQAEKLKQGYPHSQNLAVEGAHDLHREMFRRWEAEFFQEG